MSRKRPAGEADRAALAELMAEAVAAGRRDCVPSGRWLDRMLDGFDWEGRSRVVEGPDGLLAAVLLLERGAGAGAAAHLRIETAGRDPAAELELLRWGVLYARAHGWTGQVWRRRGQAAAAEGLGLRAVRPFWRMDRPDLDALLESPMPAGYRLVDGTDGPSDEAWLETYNRSFAEHWNFAPMTERRPADPRLELMALDAAGRPAALVLAELVDYGRDPRPQPVALVGIVGTLAEHRRRGLAGALTAEALGRLAALGARSASLYVDGRNPTGAARVYGRLGFAIGFEYEVYETAGISNVIS